LWSAGISTNTARVSPGSAVLSDGSVLLAGSLSGGGVSTGEVLKPGAAVWTPVTGTLNSTGAPGQSVLPLHDGSALVLGGAPSAAVDLYSPQTSVAPPSFSSGVPMTTARTGPGAIVLANGDVLVVGGLQSAGGTQTILASGEVYHPASHTWTAVPGGMSTPRAYPSVSLLPGGQVLIAGGLASASPPLSTAAADLYNPATNAFTPAATMLDSRALGAQTTLPGGRVLVAGGVSLSSGSGASLKRAELYDPVTNQWSQTGDLSTARTQQGQVLLPTGQVLDVAGALAPPGSGSAELYSAPTAPSAPSAVSALAGDGRALVTWAPTTAENGGALQNYVVTASTGQALTTPDARTDLSVPGLANGHAVTFTVRAVNQFGVGASSAASNAVVPLAPPVAVPAPKLTFTGLSAKPTLSAFLHGVSLTIGSNTPVGLDVSLRASAKNATVARALNLTLAEKVLGRSGAKRKVTLVPNRRLLGKATTFTASVIIEATDAAGNRVTVVRSIKVTKPKPKPKRKR
jgi:Kelch motif protein/fibronectin type III domain protein